MTSPVITRQQADLPMATKVSYDVTGEEGVTFHGGGPTPWSGDHIDRSSPERFFETASHARCVSIWRAWWEHHVKVQRWNDLAYNLGSCVHGFILEGRGAGVRSAANGTNTANKLSYAVVAIMGEGDPLTWQCQRAMLDARELLRAGARPAKAMVHPHSDWVSTACPPAAVDDWLAAGMPDPGGVWNPPVLPKMTGPGAAFATTPTGAGYMQVDANGGVYCHGDAMFFGSLPGLGVKPNKPIVAALISPSGGGYGLVGADGAMYAFGDFRFHGSLGHLNLVEPVISAAARPQGDGYWMHARDGGIFAFASAPYLGRAEA